MKLLHTSDWHFGKREGDISLQCDQLHFIDELCRIVREKNVDALLLAGDVYDHPLPSADATRLYDSAMTRLCVDCGIPVYVIAGNHDSAERLSNCSRLLCKSGLFVKGELSEDVSPILLGDTELFLLPWITEEKVRAVFPQHKGDIGSLTEAYRVVTDKMRRHFSPNKRHVILSHAFITDAETSVSDRAAVIGFAAQVPADVFDGFDYAALGHIHAPQKISGTVRYCGTPMPYSFGKEEKQTKGVVIFDTETLEQEFVPMGVLHPRITLSGTLSEVTSPALCESYRDYYVRLIISDCYVGLETLSELKKLYPNLFDATGKSFESENSSVTMSLKQLEELESDPAAVFGFFCREVIGEEPDGHLARLFAAAVKKAEEETP